MHPHPRFAVALFPLQLQQETCIISEPPVCPYLVFLSFYIMSFSHIFGNAQKRVFGGLGINTHEFGKHLNYDFQSTANKIIYAQPQSHLQSPLGTLFILIGKTRWFVKVFHDAQNALNKHDFFEGVTLKSTQWKLQFRCGGVCEKVTCDRFLPPPLK